jgi:hypothetical protein
VRRYRIEISGNINAVFDSTSADGSMNPGALNIEIDVSQYDFTSPIGYAHLRIWGLPLQSSKSANKIKGQTLGAADVTISQATNLNDCLIKIYAGMQKGLPLANADQYGLIIQGFIFQAYGNWVGTDMTLDMFISTNQGSTFSDPVNIVLDWKKGTPMADALKTTLMRAYPKMDPPSININSKLVLTEDDSTQCTTLGDLNQHLFDTSLSIITSGYEGVRMTVSGNQIIVYDGTLQSDPKQINFFNMIGQPTWIQPFSVQANLMLRSDLKVGDYIKFPPTPTISSEAEMKSQPADRSAFQGTFQVDMVRHLGNFRQPDPNSWLTTINAHTTPPDTASDAVPANSPVPAPPS